MILRKRTLLALTVLASSSVLAIVACGSSSSGGSGSGTDGGLGASGDDDGSIGSAVGGDGSTGASGDGGAGGGSNGDGGGGTSVQTSDQFTAAYCALYDSCCSATHRATPGAACAMAVDGADLAGTTFNADNANACLTAARAQLSNGTFCPAADAGLPTTASIASDPLAICQKVWLPPAPTQSLGQSCTQASDCIPADAGETLCNITIEDDGGEVQTCLNVVPGMQSSAPCIDDTGSTGNATTNPPSKAYSCAQSAGIFCADSNHLCQPLKVTGTTCQDDSECVSADYCNPSADPEPACALRIPVGQACPDMTGCVSGTYCDETMKCATLLANGTPSADPTQCASTLTSGNTCVSYADYLLDAYCH